MSSTGIRAAVRWPALRRRGRLLPSTSPVIRRSYAVQAPGAPTLQVFNHHAKYLQKERAATNIEESRKVDYVRDEVAMRLVERLLDVNRTFGPVLDLGAQACNIARALATPITDPAKPDESPTPMASRISSLICAESSPSLLNRDIDLPFNSAVDLSRVVLPANSELLPFEPESFDAIMSSLSLHWANDLPGVLSQCNALLRPDTPLLAAMLGGDSLFELRTSLQLASLDRRGGLAQHTSPLADVRDIGGVLQRAGFRMLTVDVDDIVVGYPDITALMRDLQAMGESNAVLGREPGPIRRDVLLAAEGIYRELHGEEVDGRFTLPATFRIIYFIAWKEGPNQAQPLQRGSGQLSMKDILEGAKTGEK